MKASDLSLIADPYARFVQSMGFLRSLKQSEEAVVAIRDRALLDIKEHKIATQKQLAEATDVSEQRISQLVQKARERYGSGPSRGTDVPGDKERATFSPPSD